MKKLEVVIRYQCETSFKYIWIFYACVFAVITILSAIAYAVTGSIDSVSANALEVNSMVYVGILGVLGFKDDFKMLIQNGFTRKYILLSTLALFAFVSAIMALVDTVLGNILHMLSKSYDSFFAGIYGYGHLTILNWLWLFLIYVLLCCILYCAVLTVNKVGKMKTIIAGITAGLSVCVLTPFLFRIVFSQELRQSVISFLMKGIGFMNDGTINLLYPILLLVLFVGVFSTCAYCIIRKTELKL